MIDCSTESGCQWRLCMLTSELTVHMLRYMVGGQVCCPLIHECSPGVQVSGEFELFEFKLTE